MTPLPPGVKVHLAFAYPDMRKGIDGLAMLDADDLFPDSNTSRRAEDPHWLYTVRFGGRELWGPESDPKAYRGLGAVSGTGVIAQGEIRLMRPG